MKEANIYIFGEIVPWQEEGIEAYGGVNLKYVMRAWESQKDAEKVVLHINSPGGDVDEGFAIHDYVRGLGLPVESRITGFCGSIATIIALAGDPDKRFMSSNSTFYIHNPWGGVGGDRKAVQDYADYLEKKENQIAAFYAQKTGITAEEALELMSSEVDLTAEEAKNKGFISEIAVALKAVAMFNPDKDSKKMSKNTKTAGELTDEQRSLYNSIMQGVKNLLPGSKAKNKVLQTGDNETELEFPNVEEDATPQEGDEATVDGKPADGSYVMPSGETYVFEEGVLKEIKPKEEEGDEDEPEEGESEEVQNLRQENERLQNELDQANAKAQKAEDLAAKMEKEQKENARAIKGIQDQLEKFQELASGEFETKQRTKNFKKTDGNRSRPVFIKEEEK